jgi:hypothetical protein
VLGYHYRAIQAGAVHFAASNVFVASGSSCYSTIPRSWVLSAVIGLALHSVALPVCQCSQSFIDGETAAASGALSSSGSTGGSASSPPAMQGSLYRRALATGLTGTWVPSGLHVCSVCYDGDDSLSLYPSGTSQVWHWLCSVSDARSLPAHDLPNVSVPVRVLTIGLVNRRV